MANPVTGTNGPDTLNGTSGDDAIAALGGDDSINASTGVDTVDGGAGSDQLNVNGALLPATAHSYTITASRIVDGSGALDTSFVGLERIALSDSRQIFVDASGFAGRLIVTKPQFSLGLQDDSIVGGSGDDSVTLTHGGHDSFDGGAGTDSLIVNIYGFRPQITVAAVGDTIRIDHGSLTIETRNVEHFVLQTMGGGSIALNVDASSLGVAMDFNLSQNKDTVIGTTGANIFQSLGFGSNGDVLSGGGGADIFRFGVGSTLNGTVIRDFDSDDRLDLSQNPSANIFIGTAAFTGVAGQYRVATFQSQTMLEIDYDGDRHADGILTLANGMFTLGETVAGSNILRITGTVPPPNPGDTVLEGGSSGDLLQGGPGDDRINGNGGDDELYGDEDDDRIDGGAGQDLIRGEEGDDILFDPGGAWNRLYGGTGNDTLIVTNGSPRGDPLPYLNGGAGDDVIMAANGVFNLAGDDAVSGDSDDNGNDVITLLNALPGSGEEWGSRIEGGGGDDTIRAYGTGWVYIRGGFGDDDITVEGFTQGEVQTEYGINSGYDYGNNVVRLRPGSFLVSLDGAQDRVEIDPHGRISASISRFNAGEEGDRIDLSVYGTDPFGTGVLTIYEQTWPSGLIETIIEHAASGSAYRIFGVSTRDLSAFNLGVDNPLYDPGPGLVLDQPHGSASTPVRRVGMDGNDLILGFNGDDMLLGAGGSDTLRGAGGADELKGGTGTDLLEGGEGDDLLDGGDGIDRLLGGNGLDRLDGGTGADRMEGGADADLYVVDDEAELVVELAGGGTDGVESRVNYTLAANVENLLLLGTAAIAGAGNALANRIVGNGAANVLAGREGDDRLDGGGGADVMKGGTGNDTYVVDDAGDKVQESAGEGVDSVEAWVGHVLAAEIETLRLMGTAALDGAGNALANTLYGNAGANRLDGRGGADRMEGGAGDDLYVVDDTGDRAIEQAGGGIDTVQSAISFELGADLENLVLTGSAALNGGGNGLANALTGNDGANWLAGVAGDDLLDGGLGADRLDGGTGADLFRFGSALGGGNVDRVTDFVVADDTIQLDRSIFAGIAADGALAAGAFRLGTAALDADDRILYDAATGNLWYDADGVGGAAAVQFARLSAGLALTSADFLAVP